MHAPRNLLGTLLLIVVPLGYALAEPPPLSKNQLEKQAALIATGTVIEVTAGQLRARGDGEEYTHELTVLVEVVEKGNSKKGVTLKVRASYIDLKPGYVGGTGHRWLKEAQPGWKLHLYLTALQGGAHGIVFPNGVDVVARPEKNASSGLPWPWVPGGGVFLSAILLIRIWVRQRLRKRKVPCAVFDGQGNEGG